MVSRDGLLSIWTSHPLKLGRGEREGTARSSLLPSLANLGGRGGGFHYYVDGSALSPSIPPVAKSTLKKRSQIIVRSEANHPRKGRRATHSRFFWAMEQVDYIPGKRWGVREEVDS